MSAVACALALLLGAAAEPLPPPPASEGAELPVPEGFVAPPAPSREPIVTGFSIVPPPGVAAEDLEPLVSIEAGRPLSRRELRSSLVRLFLSGPVGGVTARAVEEGPGQISLVFVVSGLRLLRRLDVQGVPPLDADRIRRATGLRPGDEWGAERGTDAAVAAREALARMGYRDAGVEAREQDGPEGVTLALRVTRGTPTRVAALRLRSDAPEALVRETLLLGPGDVADLDRLDAELDRLRRRLREIGHFRARVEPPIVRAREGGAGVELELRVAAGPQLALRFEGATLWDEETLRAALRYDGEELLDAAMLRELEGRLTSALRRAGRYDASVRAEELHDPVLRRDTVLFRVREGRPLRVTRVEFPGLKRLDAAALRLQVAELLEGELGAPARLRAPSTEELDPLGFSGIGATHRPAPLPVAPREVFEEELWEKVRGALVERMRDDGWLEVELDPPIVEIDEVTRLATVSLPVREGTRVTVRKVEGPPPLVGVEAEPLDAVRLAARAPLSLRRLEADRVALRAWYAREGHLFAEVDATWARDPADPAVADVRFTATPGPRVKAGTILVQGNRRTDAEVVRDALGFDTGDKLGSEELAQAQQRLLRLGIFRSAALRTLDPDVPAEVKDLVIDVRERPVRSVEVGGGVSIADGPRSFAEYTERNIGGRNVEFTARGKLNYQAFREEVRALPLDEGIERTVDLGLRQPRLYGIPVDVGARLDLVHERDIRPAYRVVKYAIIAGLDAPLGSALNAGLQYELESTGFKRAEEFDSLLGVLSRNDLERLRFPEGDTVVGAIRPSLALDLRDDPTDPHAGFLARASTEWARDLGGDFVVDFVKVSGTAAGYVPIAPRVTLALSASGGRVFPLDDASLTVPPKRFYLGGAGSLRGFSEDGVVPEDRRAALRQEIQDCEAIIFSAGCSTAARFLQAGSEVPSEGGELFVLLKSELRFPLYEELGGGLFLDAGNLWLDPSSFAWTGLRPAVGAGIRYATPVGPLALDLGVNLAPDAVLNEQSFAIHFSIGLF